MKTIKIITIALIAGFAGAYICIKLLVPIQTTDSQMSFGTVSYNNPSPYHSSSTPTTPVDAENAVDFSEAASRAIPSVVYINSMSEGSSYSYFDLLFGNSGRSQTRVSSGSGVILSQDGYIVTNNHVVGTAEKIEVNYNKHVFSAELIGTDPSTDLAVLKINETGLPAITMGNSTALQVGEWVVAVGNPFSLSSTVTVG